MLLQRAAQGVEVVVGVDVNPGPGETDAIDEARVVEGVAVDDVVPLDQRRQRADVGGVPAAEEQRRRAANQRGESPLGREVRGPRAGDQAGGAGTDGLLVGLGV